MNMMTARYPVIAATLLAWGLLATPARAAPLVTGNGYGFGVVAEGSGHLSRYYAHPYAFEAPDPADPLGEGRPTTSFISDLGWPGVAPATAMRVGYVDESQVVQATAPEGTGTVYMPFGIAWPVLVIGWRPAMAGGAPPAWPVKWAHSVASRESLAVAGTRIELLGFEGVRERLALVPLDAARAGAGSLPHDLAGHNAWALVSLERAGDAPAAVRAVLRWRAHRDWWRATQGELAAVERWRVPPPASANDPATRRVWRQSEIVLRMAQSREPDTADRHGSGLIVASLPDGLWFTPWVRDMAYAVVALARMGHFAEARAGLLAWFEARPVGRMRHEVQDADYQVSVVRYFGDGTEEPYFTMEGATNIEFDNWGLALWALGTYLDHAPRDALPDAPTYRGKVYDSALLHVVRPLIANLEPAGDGLIVRADTSIWEERQADRRHFAFSTAAAIAGLDAFARIAATRRDEITRAEVQQKVAQLRAGFRTAFVRDGSLRGTLEPGPKNDIDGALLAIVQLGVVEDDALVSDIVERMPLLRVASGGYRRVRSTYTDPGIFEYWYERQEFVFVDLALSGVLRRLGRADESRALLQKVIDDASRHHDLVPEMYVAEPCELFPGSIGDPTGAMPMAGYGAGALVLELLARS